MNICLWNDCATKGRNYLQNVEKKIRAGAMRCQGGVFGVGWAVAEDRPWSAPGWLGLVVSQVPKCEAPGVTILSGGVHFTLLPTPYSLPFSHAFVFSNCR